MSLVDQLHEKHVLDRRVRVLAKHLADAIPKDASVLDVGAGDGNLAVAIGRHRPDISFRGIDVLVRPETAIPVEQFDGVHIPVADGGVDVVMMVDVLHHTDDPNVMLREASRVAKRAVVIKDHDSSGFLATSTLRFMDDVGNRRHGVRLPYNYWPRSRWLEAIRSLGMRVTFWRDHLGLYPWPASMAFDRRLHFVVCAEPPAG